MNKEKEEKMKSITKRVMVNVILVILFSISTLTLTANNTCAQDCYCEGCVVCSGGSDCTSGPVLIPPEVACKGRSVCNAACQYYGAGFCVFSTLRCSRGCALTSTYGEGSEEVELLRKYRDTVLSTTPKGKELIDLYYKWNPTILEAMEADEKFKEEIKDIVDAILPMIEEAVE